MCPHAKYVAQYVGDFKRIMDAQGSGLLESHKVAMLVEMFPQEAIAKLEPGDQGRGSCSPWLLDSDSEVEGGEGGQSAGVAHAKAHDAVRAWLSCELNILRANLQSLAWSKPQAPLE